MNKFSSQNLFPAYKEAENFAASHYENFPVVSFLLPKELKKHVAVIYKFARLADNIADEGNVSISQRTEELNEYRGKFTLALNGETPNDFWKVVLNTIQERKLNPQYFYNLLDAFEQDITKKRYVDFDEVLRYCKNSANPVGKLMLELFDIREEEAMQLSDKICTALQLTNFYQDIKVDYEKDRIYIPQNELEKFGVKEEVFHRKEGNEQFRELLKFQVERNRRFYKEGSELLNYLQGFFRLEIKWTVSGGKKILDKIEKLDYDVLNYRPTLSKFDYILLLFRAVLKNR